MTIRHSFRYLLHRERSGRHSVIARVTSPHFAKVDCSTGVSVSDPAQWDHARQRLKTSAPKARESNLLLSDIERDADKFFARMGLVEQRPPARPEVAAMLRQAAGRETARDSAMLLTLFDTYTSAAGVGASWTIGTAAKHRTLRRHLAEWRPQARVENVNSAWMQELSDHLTGVLELRNTTAAKLLRMVLAMLRWARRSGRYNGNATEWKPRLKGWGAEQKEIIYLTIDELKRLEAHDCHGTALAVRDVFVFACYTGLRYSDLRRLRLDDIRDGCVEVVTKKTGERLRIELNSHASAILKRWRGKVEGGLALPVISDQKTNDHIKLLCLECGMHDPVRRVWWRGAERCEETVPKWRAMSVHAARRTFVVTALTLGVPAEVVMRWTGHSSWQAMRPYVAIVDELKKREMGKFEQI